WCVPQPDRGDLPAVTNRKHAPARRTAACHDGHLQTARRAVQHRLSSTSANPEALGTGASDGEGMSTWTPPTTQEEEHARFSRWLRERAFLNLPPPIQGAIGAGNSKVEHVYVGPKTVYLSPCDGGYFAFTRNGEWLGENGRFGRKDF